jgi:peptidoglycan/LPS O-acetylase OafA/YrhL
MDLTKYGMNILGLGYRAEIDGMRAIAILGVVFYHAGHLIPGGYVGVDVFFVISGYLITSLILKDIHAGRFSYSDFLERRIRRIFPALSFVVLVTVLSGAIIMTPEDYLDLAKSSIAQLIAVANFYFWRSGNYFGPAAEEKPLLHTWSLAVEEQFYLLLPLILLSIISFGRNKRPRLLILTLTICLILSLVLGIYLVCDEKAKAAFYLLPPRAWELLAGSCLAAIPGVFIPKRRSLREFLSWAGMAGIILPFLFYTNRTDFPGISAVPPCLGALFVIHSNSCFLKQDQLTSVGRLLAMKPMVFIGLISYSLYLWHWPLFAYYEYLQPAHEISTVTMGLIILSLTFAILSWRFIEIPFRQKHFFRTRRSLFRFASTIALFTLLASGFIWSTSGFPQRFGRSSLRDTLDRTALSLGDLKVQDIKDNLLLRVGNPDQLESPRILLWGDSHAKIAVPALDVFCKEQGMSGVVAVHASTPPLLEFAHASEYGLGEKTPEFSRAIVEYIKETRIKDVILAAYWPIYQKNQFHTMLESLRKTIETLSGSGCRVWVLMAVPDHDLHVRKALVRKAFFGGIDVSWQRTVYEHRERNSVLYELAEMELPAVFMDPSPKFLLHYGNRYSTESGGVCFYQDANHLTERGSLEILLPLLREKIGSCLSGVAE